MKKAVKVFISIFFISLFYATSSSASECTSSNPCHTYAEVNSSGVVVNIIVCQESVCGINGEWSGKNPNNGNRLVAQIAANPETNQSQGGIFIKPEAGGSVVTESNGVFTVNNNNPVIKNESVNVPSGEAVSISTNVQKDNSVSFTFQDTVGKNIQDVQMNIIDLPESTTASIKIDINKTNYETVTVQETFTTRKTEDQVKQEIVENNQSEDYYNVLQYVFPTIIKLLGRWPIMIFV